ncbi:MAG: hypothetical protein ACQUHE_05465 [Bacteroidia bacterium]
MSYSSKATIYHALFASMSTQTNVDQMIKEVQERVGFYKKRKPGPKTWKALCRLIIGEGLTATQKNKASLDPHNEEMISNMGKEIAPFAKELICLAQEQGINIRLLGGVNFNEEPACSMYGFGLTFDIGIFDQTASGELIYNGNILLYANVAKLAESIGLTWAADQKTFSHQSRFELRPGWALRMSEKDMLKEIQRRKDANLNLLAMLD